MSKYTIERNNLLNDFNKKSYVNDFEGFALRLFRFQYQFNEVYKMYCDLLKIEPNQVKFTKEIPFLPIELFKNYKVITGKWKEESVFLSSGTTAMQKSKHYVRDQSFYIKNALDGFEERYGDASQYVVLAILPGYGKTGVSSLVTMVNELIRKSVFGISGFYLDKNEDLEDALKFCKKNKYPTILFGVSFGLLELSDLNIGFPELIIIETGGMKNSKIELTKEAIITKLKSSWKNTRIHSEYGMTELFSQSYSSDNKWYKPMNTKKVFIGELSDPFHLAKHYKPGVLKIIDLANIDTCAFIETQDLGMSDDTNQFQVLGRLDNAEVRGCNLLLEDAL